MKSPKNKKDVRCRGQLPGTTVNCKSTAYQSDGEFVWLDGMRINPHLDRQTIECKSCGYMNIWRRNEQVSADNQRI